MLFSAFGLHGSNYFINSLHVSRRFLRGRLCLLYLSSWLHMLLELGKLIEQCFPSLVLNLGNVLRFSRSCRLLTRKWSRYASNTVRWQRLVLVFCYSELFGVSSRVCLSSDYYRRNFTSSDRMSCRHFLIRAIRLLLSVSSRILLLRQYCDCLFSRLLLFGLCLYLHSLPSRLLLSFHQFTTSPV